MLLFFSILALLGTAFVGMMITWANMMSDAPTVQISYWSLLFGIALSVALFVLWWLK